VTSCPITLLLVPDGGSTCKNKGFYWGNGMSEKLMPMSDGRLLGGEAAVKIWALFMIKYASWFRRFGLKMVVFVAFALPILAGAQSVFQYNPQGDVLAGFRRSGSLSGQYQVVADLGNVTNLIKLSAGTQITITNFTAGQLSDAFTNNNNLQWSVFSTFPSQGRTAQWVTPLGTFPGFTIWYTLPGTSVTTQTQAPPRQGNTQQANQVTLMNSVGTAAQTISGYSSESVDNTNSEVRESVQYPADILSAFIADNTYPTNGDFGSQGTPLPNEEDVENNTGASFTAAERSDFYQVCPTGTTDPISGSTTSANFLGYFLLNPNGSMTFTRAAAVTAPTAGTLTASATNGFGPLTVTFTNTASGSITNWVWNFGDGISVTNTTGATVTHVYTTAGSYTVTLTVYGPGGSSSVTVASFIVTSPTPAIALATQPGKLIFNGSNCPAGVQYRILSTTNLQTSLGSWKPIYTNTFGSNGTFSYTNLVGGTNSFFIMVSP
jgi:PKD repeat protein